MGDTSACLSEHAQIDMADIGVIPVLLAADTGISPWLLADLGPPGSELPIPSDAPVEKSVQNKITVLLAEDNRADVLIIEEAIALYGLPFELHVVRDGAKALEFIERAERDPEARCPQMLLLDLNLPKRSGREVLQRLRESAKCKDIPVVVITSSNSQKDRKDMQDLRVDRYFCKPADYDDFVKVGEVLKTLVDEYRI